MKTRLTAALVLGLCALAGAEDGVVAGRRVLAKNQEAVVTVRLVINYKMSFQGRDQQRESQTDTFGTVVDPSGLTVISLTTIDPSAMMGRASGFKIETEVKDVKIMLPDGTELPAWIVLRDKDLDIAFLRPTEKVSKPLAAVDLGHAAKPQLLDEVVCLTRLGKVADRAVEVSLERIAALVDRPRPYYIVAAGGPSGVGSPFFAESGEPLGIMLVRNARAESEANMGSVMSGTNPLGAIPIVVPAADILADAKQALAAKKPAGPGP